MNCSITISSSFVLLRLIKVLLGHGSLGVLSLILGVLLLNQSGASLLLWKISEEFIVVSLVDCLSSPTRGIADCVLLLIHANCKLQRLERKIPLVA